MLANVLAVDFASLWEREKREEKKRLLFASLLVLVFVLMGAYLYLQSSAIASNSELENINNEIYSIESKLKQHNIAQDEILHLSQGLKTLKDIKKTKMDTLKWFGLLHSSMAHKAKEAYNLKGVDAALFLLESSKSMAEDEAYAKKYASCQTLYRKT